MEKERLSTMEIRKIQTAKYEIKTLESASSDEYITVELWDVEIIPKE